VRASERAAGWRWVRPDFRPDLSCWLAGGGQKGRSVHLPPYSRFAPGRRDVLTARDRQPRLLSRRPEIARAQAAAGRWGATVRWVALDAADSDGFLNIDAAGVIPFEPKSAGLLEARTRVRAALASFVAEPGELLHGVIEGPACGATDLDNALLYNIGGRVAAATRYGVLLERWATPGPGARYRYRLTRSHELAGSRRGSTLAEFNSVPLAGPPPSWLGFGPRFVCLRGSRLAPPGRSGSLPRAHDRRAQVLRISRRSVRKDHDGWRAHRVTRPRRPRIHR